MTRPLCFRLSAVLRDLLRPRPLLAPAPVDPSTATAHLPAARPAGQRGAAGADPWVHSLSLRARDLPRVDDDLRRATIRVARVEAALLTVACVAGLVVAWLAWRM